MPAQGVQSQEIMHTRGIFLVISAFTYGASGDTVVVPPGVESAAVLPITGDTAPTVAITAGATSDTITVTSGTVGKVVTLVSRHVGSAGGLR